MSRRVDDSGYTLVELVIGLAVFAVIAICVYGLFISLSQSQSIAKRQAVASALATNQMEYLKSLPYNSLAIVGGSIAASNPLPATTTKTINGVKYTIKSSINYVDDAFDGCANYPNLSLKQLYCRNYPAPSGAPNVDSNPQDYKIVHVSVTDKRNSKLAEVDTQISARVAETASSTGALFVTVIDEDGNPVSGATVRATNTVLASRPDVSDTTDSNGNAIFYGLPPDISGYNYVITASKTDYSSLTTIAPVGSLQPNYPSQRIFTQQSSLVTLTIAPQGSPSLVVETTDTSGNPLGNAKVYIKGGYKKYSNATDTSYYYDNLSPVDNRLQTAANGLASLDDLVPGSYTFCGDQGATSCQIGGTTYYLAAALPYGGSNSLTPITVPSYLASAPPTTTFPYNSANYLQKVRLMLTASPTHPRVNTISASEASLSAGLSSYAFSITGANLLANSAVRFTNGINTYTAACTGGSGAQLDCTVDLSSANTGALSLVITANGSTLTLPTTPLGGINVIP